MFLGNLCGLSSPVFAYTKVEFVASLITAEYPITQWADEVEFGVQISRHNPCFGLMAREPLKFCSTFAFTILVIGHDGGMGSNSQAGSLPL